MQKIPAVHVTTPHDVRPASAGHMPVIDETMREPARVENLNDESAPVRETTAAHTPAPAVHIPVVHHTTVSPVEFVRYDTTAVYETRFAPADVEGPTDESAAVEATTLEPKRVEHPKDESADVAATSNTDTAAAKTATPPVRRRKPRSTTAKPVRPKGHRKDKGAEVNDTAATAVEPVGEPSDTDTAAKTATPPVRRRKPRSTTAKPVRPKRRRKDVEGE